MDSPPDLLVTPRTTATAVKAVDLGDGTTRVEGYLVVFDDPASPVKDMAGDYFTSDTYFGARKGDGVDCLFHHGIPVKAELAGLADTILPPLTVKADDHGLFASVVLDMADEYHATIAGLAAKGKLGWSSGSAGHMVKRAPDGHLSRWPIIEGSLTPQPCEPRTVMKSMPTLKAEGESLSARIDRVYRAGYDGLNGLGYIAEVFEDHVVAEMSGLSYRVPYTDDGTVVTFAPAPQWEQVQRTVTYDPVKALKSINDRAESTAILNALSGIGR